MLPPVSERAHTHTHTHTARGRGICEFLPDSERKYRTKTRTGRRARTRVCPSELQSFIGWREGEGYDHVGRGGSERCGTRRRPNTDTVPLPLSRSAGEGRARGRAPMPRSAEALGGGLIQALAPHSPAGGVPPARARTHPACPPREHCNEAVCLLVCM